MTAALSEYTRAWILAALDDGRDAASLARALRIDVADIYDVCDEDAGHDFIRSGGHVTRCLVCVRCGMVYEP